MRMMEDKKSEEAIQFIKKNRQLLIDKFASDEVCPPSSNPVAIFMAGSPGAGKTEFSRNYLAISGKKAVRIDADDIRQIVPGYTGKNSDSVQGAAALGVEKLFDYALKTNKDLILDATFVDDKKAIQNIERCLKKCRRVTIKAKTKFQNQISVSIIIKNYKTNELKIISDISSEDIDKYCRIQYSKQALINQL